MTIKATMAVGMSYKDNDDTCLSIDRPADWLPSSLVTFFSRLTCHSLEEYQASIIEAITITSEIEGNYETEKKN